MENLNLSDVNIIEQNVVPNKIVEKIEKIEDKCDIYHKERIELIENEKTKIIVFNIKLNVVLFVVFLMFIFLMSYTLFNFYKLLY